ncbi:MAG TPA: hypothetical protein DHV48_02660 [Prolixibacteraceae bacterium]|nr:hypothetical protein [Prolixibacteraceae bacterium]
MLFIFQVSHTFKIRFDYKFIYKPEKLQSRFDYKLVTTRKKSKMINVTVKKTIIHETRLSFLIVLSMMIICQFCNYKITKL